MNYGGLMNDQEKNDLLIKIDTRLEKLCEDFNKVSNGEGFTRCASRKIELRNLTKSVLWMRNTFYTTGFVLIIAGVVKYLLL